MGTAPHSSAISELKIFSGYSSYEASGLKCLLALIVDALDQKSDMTLQHNVPQISASLEHGFTNFVLLQNSSKLKLSTSGINILTYDEIF